MAMVDKHDVSLVAVLERFRDRAPIALNSGPSARRAEALAWELVVPYKEWTTARINHGRDCSLYNFVFQLSQNGASHFQGELYSSDTGDEWDMQIALSSHRASMM
jgi:hypothetical protein